MVKLQVLIIWNDPNSDWYECECGQRFGVMKDDLPEHCPGCGGQVELPS